MREFFLTQIANFHILKLLNTKIDGNDIIILDQIVPSVLSCSMSLNYGFEKKAFEFSKALKMFKINFAPNFVIIKLSRSIYNTLINHF